MRLPNNIAHGSFRKGGYLAFGPLGIYRVTRNRHSGPYKWLAVSTLECTDTYAVYAPTLWSIGDSIANRAVRQ